MLSIIGVKNKTSNKVAFCNPINPHCEIIFLHTDIGDRIGKLKP